MKCNAILTALHNPSYLANRTSVLGTFPTSDNLLFLALLSLGLACNPRHVSCFQVMDLEGNENNEIEVERLESNEIGSQDSLDSWERVEIPAEEELEKQSLENAEASKSTVEVGVETSQCDDPSILMSNVTSMTTSAKEESISVVERVFNVNHGTTVEALKSNGAELLEEEEFEDEYWDTEDFRLTRKGLWLRLRKKKGSECWQLRKLDEQSKLNLVTEEKAVAVRLKEELGMEGEGVPEVMEILLSNHFKKMLSFLGSSSKWRLGVVEVELRRENKMDTASVRVVGEVMAALQVNFGLGFNR